MADWIEQFGRDGYTLLRGVFNDSEMEAARQACAAALARNAGTPSVLAGQGGPAYGARNLLRLWPGVLALVRAPALAAPLVRLLGPGAAVTRGLYFDKPPGSTWALPWHRDLTIAVKQAGPLGYFVKPTRKAGVPHVEAPAALLAGMVTARIHLDEVTGANGPLRVIPGSHAHTEAAPVNERAAVVLTCAAGDVLLMRPLLLHSSGHSVPGHAGHRRVVHLELAPAADLPDGYTWHDYLPLNPAAGLVSNSLGIVTATP